MSWQNWFFQNDNHDKFQFKPSYWWKRPSDLTKYLYLILVFSTIFHKIRRKTHQLSPVMFKVRISQWYAWYSMTALKNCSPQFVEIWHNNWSSIVCFDLIAILDERCTYFWHLCGLLDFFSFNKCICQEFFLK